jgi:hypothetical protein
VYSILKISDMSQLKSQSQGDLHKHFFSWWDPKFTISLSIEGTMHIANCGICGVDEGETTI